MRGLWLVLSWLAFTNALVAADVSGRVVLTGPGAKSRDAAPAVIWFVPDTAVPPARKKTVSIKTRDKTFDPRVIAVPVGSTVDFPNGDPILHNVFSLSPGNRFDLGLYGPGDGDSHVFAETGIVRLFCNVHHSMVAHIVVLDTPFFTTAAADLSFGFVGLPDGSGTLSAWHELGGAVVQQRVEFPTRAVLEIELELVRRRVPRHLDKNGRPYSKTDRERYE